jgi:hypothetical protein
LKGYTLVRKPLLTCGILSSLFYLAAIILGALRWESYSSITQYVSELSAIGAPTRSLVVPLLLISDVLLIAFGFGLWASGGRKRAMHVLGGLFIGCGIVA